MSQKKLSIDEEYYVRAYMVSMVMLALVDEFGKHQLGAGAKLHNKITKKHAIFHKQVLELQQKKRKRISEKALCFVKGSSLVRTAWNNMIDSLTEVHFCANTMLRQLYNLNKESLEKLYSVDESIFMAIDNDTSHKLVLSSCKVARICMEEINKQLNSHYGGENIYDKVS